MPKWTENQQNAIDSRGGSVLVSAAAGSGKTAVLVQRVIERITDTGNPIDADRLLVVTYTRAAAAEMKERIQKRLNELIRKDPMNPHLQRQQMLLPCANISTIHSFCSSVVKDNFYSLDISPAFRLAEESELTLLQNDALNNVLEELFNDENKDFELFANVFSNAKNDRSLASTVLGLYTFLCSHAFPDKWLNEMEQMYDITGTVAQTAWGSVITAYAKDAAEFCVQLCADSAAIYGEHPEFNKNLNQLFKYDSDFFGRLYDLTKQGNWDSIRNEIFNFKPPCTLTFGKGMKDGADQDHIRANRTRLKDTIKSLDKLFMYDESTCCEQIHTLSPVVHQLCITVRKFSEEYSRLKKEKNWLDYSDLEHLTLKVLINDDGSTFTEQAKNISDRFAEVMVDEYQDANSVQEMIFRAVSNNGKKLFTVGDVKQSIYSFRQAMPQIFIDRKDSYSLYDKAKDNYPAKIILDKNFRSRKGITDGVNFVFKRLLSKEVGDIEYSDDEKLIPGAVYGDSDTPDVALHMLNVEACLDDDETTGEENEFNSDIEEAKHIAQIIKNMVGGAYMVTEGDSTRPARYSDFAILLRSSNAHSAEYTAQLSALGIPAACETVSSFLSSYEIGVMTSLLKIIDNPSQDIPLLTVLMSPIYAFTPDDMAQIRLCAPKKTLYNALKEYANSGNEKAQDFLQQIGEFRSKAARSAADVLINTIYTVTGFADIAAATPNGKTAVNNLRLLQEYAKAGEANGYNGLCSFVRYLNRMEEQKCDLPASGGGSDPNTVKIMSIHKSKGLEFPVCFIAALSRKFNDSNADQVLLHRNLGLGIRYKTPDKMISCNTMPREAVIVESKKDSRSEELRVLYVAMTRAREKLFMIGTKKNCNKYLKDLSTTITNSDKVAPYLVRNASSMADWILRCAMMHPSGEQLRKDALCNIVPATDNGSMWDIKVINVKVGKPSASECVKAELSPAPIEAAPQATISLDQLKSRFDAVYKYEKYVNAPVKAAVSTLSHQIDSGDSIIMSHPGFLLNHKLTPAQKGTAMHTFMQFADYKAAKNNMQEELSRLLHSGYMTKIQIESLDTLRLADCLKSSTMERFFHAEETFREYRFTVRANADIIDDIDKLEFDEKDNTIIIQGAVDCAFIENGEIVIIDYKTDKVKNVAELAQRYKSQLKLYKYAMEQTTGKRVKECIIFSLSLNETVNV